MTLNHGTLQVGNVSVISVRGEAAQVSLISDENGVAIYEWFGMPTLDDPNYDDFTCTIGTDRFAAHIVYVR